MLPLQVLLAWRNIVRRSFYTIIEVAGLALGLACFFIVLLFVEKQFNADTFFTDHDKIYRILNHEQGSGNRYSGGASAIAHHLHEEVAEVADIVRLWYPYRNYSTRGIIRYNDISFYEDNVIEADSNFFQFFDFRFVQGNSSTALRHRDAIVLSERAASKLFPDGDALGKIVGLDEERSLIVTGVVNVPVGTHLSFDYLRPAHRLPSQLYVWAQTLAFTYVKVPDKKDVPSVQRKIDGIVLAHATEADAEYLKSYDHLLQPLNEITTTVLQWDIVTAHAASQLWAILAIAVFILVLAIVNFVNLATALTTERMKDSGINKILGASRWHLILSFYVEFLLITIIAGLVAMALILGVMEPFNVLADVHLQWRDLFTAEFLTIFVSVLLITSFLSGIYPAWRLSRFGAVQSLTQTLKPTVAERTMRQTLVVFQFVISLTLLAGTIVVNRQIRFMQSADLGFNQQNIYVLRIPSAAYAPARQLRLALSSHPQIKAIAGASGLIGGEPGSDTFHPDHMPDQTPDTFAKNIAIDTAFLRLIGVPLIAGRNFQWHNVADMRTSYILNETAVRQFQMKDPINANFRRSGDLQGKIIGVMKDFHFAKMSERINPMVFYFDTLRSQRYMMISISGSPSTAVSSIEEAWARFLPEYPMEGFFQDQYFNNLYKQEQQVSSIAGIFAVLALILASMGLLGISSFIILKREKEIGIRKVIGATAAGIVFLLSGGFLRMIFIAFAISIPLTIILMQQWLNQYAVRIDVGWITFIVAGGVTVFTSAVAIGWQALKAAMQNPVKALRRE
ncbi:ABC transporter permease [Chryseolinea sp. T2]|uniref:ABC transporter permease n=1 Tax=Chryseolinea sp. T2 TaxID=3129255 RepID=UPI003078045D